jgi:GntR family transcriptional repressor for pyruvate dehydrogenase complex
MNIAYASKNIVHIHLMKSFYDLQAYAMSYSYEAKLDALGIDDVIEKQHNHIFNAICSHDPDHASKTMEEHIALILDICIEHGL